MLFFLCAVVTHYQHCQTVTSPDTHCTQSRIKTTRRSKEFCAACQKPSIGTCEFCDHQLCNVCLRLSKRKWVSPFTFGVDGRVVISWKYDGCYVCEGLRYALAEYQHINRAVPRTRVFYGADKIVAAEDSDKSKTQDDDSTEEGQERQDAVDDEDPNEVVEIGSKYVVEQLLD